VNLRLNLARLFAAIAILAAALGALGVMGWVAFDRLLITHTSEGKCWRYSDHECWDLTPEFLSRATDVDLPDGTVVQKSQTSAWLSWRLSATVELPKNGQLPRQGSAADPVIKLVGYSRGHAVCRIYLVEDADDAPWPTPK
jgi:hypothetical protein